MKSSHRIGVFVTLSSLLLLNTFLDSGNRYLKQEEKEEEKAAPHTNYVTDHELRVLSFGSSRTWGAGLKDRSTMAFPGMLQGTNMGVCGSDANYPSMCAHSMVGDDAIYDIITIEYMSMAVVGTHDPIELLAKRLRHRFPDALIIFLNLWTLHQFFRPQHQQQELRQYVLEATTMMEPNNPTIPRGALEEALQLTTGDNWKFNNFDADSILEQIAHEVNGTVLTLATPDPDDSIASILRVAPMYLTDMSHFSELGHEWITNRIVDIVQAEQLTERSDRTNPWDMIDVCLSWYESGTITNHDAVRTNMPMKQFTTDPNTPGTHFSLEASNTLELNTMKFTNTNSNPQHLYLSHMVTGPHELYPSEIIASIYPTMESLVADNDNDENTNTTHRVVRNWYNETLPQYAMHAVNHHYIGEIPVGTSYLNLKTTTPSNSKNTYDPFRTVGILLAPAAFVDKVEALF